MWWCVQQTEWLVLVVRAYFKDPKIIISKKKKKIRRNRAAAQYHSRREKGRLKCKASNKVILCVRPAEGDLQG